ncbi:hypothetical protein [Mucilaginibacter sp.]
MSTTVSEHFNQCWLLRAITAPCSYWLEQYYYDYKRKELFSVLHLPDYNPMLMILDKFSLRYPVDIEADVAVRLELIAYKRMKIIEIERMSIAEKIGVQMQFLSILSDKLHQLEYMQTVINQNETHGFVLDTLLKQYHSSKSLVPYWEHVKLQLAADYINKLKLSRGIDLTNAR